MSRNETKDILETTIYRIPGDSQSHVVQYVLRDGFTCTLLAMVLATNLLIILIPVGLSLLDFTLAKSLGQMVTIALLAGYAALLVLLVSRLKSQSKAGYPDKGHIGLTHVPRFRNAIIGIQCLLFASLLCSTFLVRQQLGLINLVDPRNYTEHILSKDDAMPDSRGTSLMPLLRRYISM